MRLVQIQVRATHSIALVQYTFNNAFFFHRFSTILVRSFRARRLVDLFARTLYRRDAALRRRARRSWTKRETRRGGGGEERRCSRDSWQPVARGHARSSRRSCTRRLVVGGYRDVLILPRVPRGEIDTHRDPFPFPFLSLSLFFHSSSLPPCFRARWVRHSSISSRRTCRRQKKGGKNMGKPVLR